MSKLKIKKAIILLMFGLGLWSFSFLAVSAQGTIIPKIDISEDAVDCSTIINEFNTIAAKEEKYKTENVSGLLACGVQTGRISLPMIPYFIQYFSNYLLGLVSLISVLFIVIGGLFYNFGAMTKDKDKGKAFIKNAIIGMVVAFMAWGIVSVIIAAVTG